MLKVYHCSDAQCDSTMCDECADAWGCVVDLTLVGPSDKVSCDGSTPYCELRQ